ncbi:PhoD-like phosphatase-domain-containing protein [Blastocladiella britannica]|nr:PhoD-like phosphatase-domain-containing protein [Blastocladiella britannica]
MHAARLLVAPTRLATAATAVFSTFFAVSGVLALTRAPFWQLTMYHWIFFALSLLSWLVWGFVHVRAARGRRRYAYLRALATAAAGVVATVVLMALILDQTMDIRIRSYADVKAVRLAAPSQFGAAVMVRDPTAASVTAAYTAANGSAVEVKATFSADSDFVAVLTLTNLPAAGSKVTLTNDRGEKYAADGADDGVMLVKPLPPTAPNKPYRIAYGSCTLPYPYRRGQVGYDNVVATQPDLFIHLGDFIYADLPLIIGDTLDAYRRMYRRNLVDSSYTKLMHTIPSLHTSDDHEIKDNWSFLDRDPYNVAMRAYREYVHAGHPAMPPPPAGIAALPESNRWFYNVTLGGDLMSIYVMQLRAYRQFSDPSWSPAENDASLEPEGSTHLGKVQKDDLKRWLLDQQAAGVTWKLIVSSVPFTLNYQDRDTWYGFRREHAELLEFIDANKITNVHVISGDRHEVGIFKVDLPTSKKPIYDMSVSPINAFYDDIISSKDSNGQLFAQAAGASFVGALDVERNQLTLNVFKGQDKVFNLVIPKI